MSNYATPSPLYQIKQCGGENFSFKSHFPNDGRGRVGSESNIAKGKILETRKVIAFKLPLIYWTKLFSHFLFGCECGSARIFHVSYENITNTRAVDFNSLVVGKFWIESDGVFETRHSLILYAHKIFTVSYISQVDKRGELMLNVTSNSVESILMW